MKAAIYNQNDKLIIKEIPQPSLTSLNGGDGAIIKVHGCGLCGSDIVKLKQNLVPSGTVLGHEVVGEIVELKSSTDKFKVGDHVVLGHHVPCYHCVYCKAGNYSMCREFKQTNIIPGGFSEYIYVSQAHLDHTVAKIPDSLSDIDAAFMEPAACCLRAVRRADVKPNEHVLIIGLGSIGLLLGQIAKHFGAVVCGCDLLDERLDIARRHGFDSAIRYQDNEHTSDFYKSLISSDFSGRVGADKIFLASGSGASLPFALACIRDGGVISVFSSIKSYSAGFPNNDIYYRELTVMGSYSPSPADLHDSLKLLQTGIIKVEDYTTEYRLDEINTAIEDTLSNRILKAFIRI